MKKLLIIVGIIALIISTVSFAKEFSDVDESLKTYKEAIDFLSKNDIISGYTDGTFKPKANVTRAELATLIYKAFVVNDLSLPTEKILNVKDFEDVKGTWSEKYVKVCIALEIVKGYEDDTFRPNNNVTYGEICAMICRLLKIEVDEGEDWARAYLKAAEEKGLLDNIMTNDVIPSNKVSRMNVAMIIYNAFSYMNTPSTPSGEIKKEEKEEKQEEKKEETKEQEKTSTGLDALTVNKIYYGKVVLEKNQRGTDYIEVETFDGQLITLEVKKVDKKPGFKSLIVFKVLKNGKVSLIKELQQALLDLDDFYVVKEAEDVLATIEGEEETLDISLDRYTLGGNVIRLDRLDYYMVSVVSNGDSYEYDDCEAIKKDDISLKEDDRLLFDTKNDVCFIIRGIESEEE